MTGVYDGRQFQAALGDPQASKRPGLMLTPEQRALLGRVQARRRRMEQRYGAGSFGLVSGPLLARRGRRILG